MTPAVLWLDGDRVMATDGSTVFACVETPSVVPDAAVSAVGVLQQRQDMSLRKQRQIAKTSAMKSRLAGGGN